MSEPAANNVILACQGLCKRFTDGGLDVTVLQGVDLHAAIIVVAGEAVRTKAPMARAEQEERIEPGSLLGEMAMMIETDYSSTVVARSNVRALRITRATMLEIMLHDAALAEHLVAKVARRLHAIATELRKIDVVLAAGSENDRDDDAAARRCAPASDRNDGRRHHHPA